MNLVNIVENHKEDAKHHKERLDGVLNFDMEKITDLLKELSDEKEVMFYEAVRYAIEYSIDREQNRLSDLGADVLKEIEVISRLVTARFMNDYGIDLSTEDSISIKNLLPIEVLTRISNCQTDEQVNMLTKNYLKKYTEFNEDSNTVKKDKIQLFVQEHLLNKPAIPFNANLIALKKRELAKDYDEIRHMFSRLMEDTIENRITEESRDLQISDLRTSIAYHNRTYEYAGKLSKAKVEDIIYHLIDEDFIGKTPARFCEKLNTSRDNFTEDMYEICFSLHIESSGHMDDNLKGSCVLDFEKECIYALLSFRIFGNYEQIDGKAVSKYIRECLKSEEVSENMTRLTKLYEELCSEFVLFRQSELHELDDEMEDFDPKEMLSGTAKQWIKNNTEMIEKLLNEEERFYTLTKQIDNLQQLLGFIGKKVHPSLNGQEHQPVRTELHTIEEPEEHVSKKMKVDLSGCELERII